MEDIRPCGWQASDFCLTRFAVFLAYEDLVRILENHMGWALAAWINIEACRNTNASGDLNRWRSMQSSYGDDV